MKDVIVKLGKSPKRIPGFLFSGVAAGIKSDASKRDIALMVSTEPKTAVAGLFTQNAFRAAPVRLCQDALRANRQRARAIIVNSGNANAGTGLVGEQHAREMQATLSSVLNLRSNETLVSSTGKIGVMLPIENVQRGIIAATHALSPSGFHDAAEAICTTDQWVKVAHLTGSLKGKPYTLAAMAKGAGMIAPSMATLLAYGFTDLAVSPRFLKTALVEAARVSLNAMSVDGDRSTNDTLLVLANGCAGNRVIDGGKDGATLIDNLALLFTYLAKEIVRDGEGATHFMNIGVSGGKSDKQARAIAAAIGNSQLVKCAIHGNDPNWGRILSTAGATDPSIEPNRVSLSIAGVSVFAKGAPSAFSAKTLSRRLKSLTEVPIDLHLGLGKSQARFYASDLTQAYVHFNSAYTT